MNQRMYLCNADGQLAAHLPCNMHNAASFCSRPYRENFFGGCDTICQRASQERDASLHERRVLSQRYDSAMGDRKFCEQSLRALPCTGGACGLTPSAKQPLQCTGASMELLFGCSSPARTGVQLVAGAVLASAAVCLQDGLQAMLTALFLAHCPCQHSGL